MKTIKNTKKRRGILTSAYKRKIRRSVSRTKAASISKIKATIKKYHRKQYSETSLIVRLSAVVILIIVFCYFR